MCDFSDFDFAWREAGQRRFEAAYSPEDAGYEQSLESPIGAATVRERKARTKGDGRSPFPQYH
jgi:hypothetical protein